MRNFYVYVVASKANGTLYFGVTNNLERRNSEHALAEQSSFTKKYHVHRLVYYEEIDTAEAAIAREEQLKNWHRQWKINLIKSMNSTWQDLSPKYRMGGETSLA